MILIEGGLIADLQSEENREQLTYLIGRFFGTLKARHQRLTPILLVLEAFENLKFINFFLAPYFRATEYSGDQIGACCCDNFAATIEMMNRLLVGKELTPSLATKGVLDQAAMVRSRFLPRLVQLFMSTPHLTNRYLNLIAFSAQKLASRGRSLQPYPGPGNLGKARHRAGTLPAQPVARTATRTVEDYRHHRGHRRDSRRNRRIVVRQPYRRQLHRRSQHVGCGIDAGERCNGNISNLEVTVPAQATDGQDSAGTPVGYGSEQMFDADPATCWRMAGDGAGQYLQISFSSPPISTTTIRLQIGSTTSPGDPNYDYTAISEISIG